MTNEEWSNNTPNGILCALKCQCKYYTSNKYINIQCLHKWYNRNNIKTTN